MLPESGQWPVVAPGFMYVVKISDFTHVLQAADLAASKYLNLTQFVIRDISVARNLLNDRGPFLLAEKQLKMSQIIDDNEQAINRVVKILEPARVEEISTQSIRFNTQNPWALADSPKAAATFGRLQLTYNRLKTVVHDLKNIEETAQQDDQAPQANTTTSKTRRRQSTPETPPPSNQLTGQQLLTWKRSRRNHRTVPNNNISPVSGATPDDDRDMNELLSPLSVHGDSSNAFDNETAQQRDDIDRGVDQMSDVSTDRLPVIHELDDASIVQLGPVRPTEVVIQARESAVPQTNVVEEEEEEEESSRNSFYKSTSNRDQNTIATAPKEAQASAPSTRPSAILESRAKNRMKRESFAETRQHERSPRQASHDVPDRPQQPPVEVRPAVVPPIAEDADSQSEDIGRFRSLKERHPPEQTGRSSITKDIDRGMVNVDQQRSYAEQISRTAMKQRTATLPDHLFDPLRGSTPSDKGGLEKKIDSSAWSNKPGLYPPIVTKDTKSQDNWLLVTGDSKNDDKSPSNTILSPSRTQLSPQEQQQSPQTPEKPEVPQPQPHERNPQIFSIDPELTKLPSILRAAHARPVLSSRPNSSTSDAKAEPRDELYFSGDDSNYIVPHLDRSTTAPPLSHTVDTGSQISSLEPGAKEDHSHQRSMSDTVVPRINVTRVPTVPRKPLPYRNSASSSRTHSPHEVSRINTPVQKPDVVRPHPNAPPVSEGTSGPPSPIHEEHRGSLALPRPRAGSTHSLSVQAPSSGASSRRSSISAEDTSIRRPVISEKMVAVQEKIVSIPPRTVSTSGMDIPIPGPTAPREDLRASSLEVVSPGRNVTMVERTAQSPINMSPAKENRSNGNPLAMHPPAIPDRQQTAYQAQSGIQVQIPSQPVISQPDYRSPAFQQSRTFIDPSHNFHIGHTFHTSHAANVAQGPNPSVQSFSRFRDQDQARSSPIPMQQGRQESAGPSPQGPPADRLPEPEVKKSARGPGHIKNSFLRRQAANLSAQQQDVNFQPSAYIRPENMGPPRVILTPHQPREATNAGPPNGPNYTVRAVAADIPPQNGSANLNEQRLMSKDKHTARQQISPATPGVVQSSNTYVQGPQPAKPIIECHCDDDEEQQQQQQPPRAWAMPSRDVSEIEPPAPGPSKARAWVMPSRDVSEIDPPAPGPSNSRSHNDNGYPATSRAWHMPSHMTGKAENGGPSPSKSAAVAAAAANNNYTTKNNDNTNSTQPWQIPPIRMPDPTLEMPPLRMSNPSTPKLNNNNININSVNNIEAERSWEMSTGVIPGGMMEKAPDVTPPNKLKKKESLLDPEAQQQTAGAGAVKPKKRSSWLKHQASKMAKRTGS